MRVAAVAYVLAVAAIASSQKREVVENLHRIARFREKLRDFDIDRDFYFDFVAEAISNIVRTGLSRNGGAVSTILRFTTMLNVARFDANAPYTATAVGITTKLPRRPQSEWSLRNKNLVCIYAGYRVMMGVIPDEEELILQFMYDLNLDPNDNREDDYSPIGIGNLCGNNVVKDRLNDGANQLGNEGGRRYNLEPYSDYTDYKTVNTGEELLDPSRWQPFMESNGKGMFRNQKFVTPHYGLVRPYLIEDVNEFEVGPHKRILTSHNDLTAYKESADEVIRESALLNDDRKMKAEFYEDKIRSVLGSVMHVARTRGLGIDQFNEIELISNMAMFDTMIVVWKEKRRWDAVRPFTAIKYLYGDKPITAWGGPYNGTVYDIPANEWRHYLPVADHPEYPSASTGACVAHSEAMKLYLGSDDLSWRVGFEQGESRIEPGLTPAQNLTIFIPTFSDFGSECGQSRLWAGVHFQDAIDSIKDISGRIAQLAVSFVLSHANAEPAIYHQPAVEVQELPRKSLFPGHLALFPASTAPIAHRTATSYSSREYQPTTVPFSAERNPKSHFENIYSFSIGRKK